MLYLFQTKEAALISQYTHGSSHFLVIPFAKYLLSDYRKQRGVCAIWNVFAWKLDKQMPHFFTTKSIPINDVPNDEAYTYIVINISQQMDTFFKVEPWKQPYLPPYSIQTHRYDLITRVRWEIIPLNFTFETCECNIWRGNKEPLRLFIGNAQMADYVAIKSDIIVSPLFSRRRCALYLM